MCAGERTYVCTSFKYETFYVDGFSFKSYSSKSDFCVGTCNKGYIRRLPSTKGKYYSNIFFCKTLTTTFLIFYLGYFYMYWMLTELAIHKDFVSFRKKMYEVGIQNSLHPSHACTLIHFCTWQISKGVSSQTLLCIKIYIIFPWTFN